MISSQTCSWVVYKKIRTEEEFNKEIDWLGFDPKEKYNNKLMEKKVRWMCTFGEDNQNKCTKN